MTETTADRMEMPAAAAPEPSSRWVPWMLAAGALLAIAALWVRLPALGVSLWWDEAYSARQFIPYGPTKIIDPLYYLPNNHILFNLLAWATTAVVGTTEAILRFWSVVPALAAGGVIGWWGWRRHGPVAGVAAALIILSSPVHLGLSVQARGYGLGFLAAALMLVGAIEMEEGGGWLAAGVMAAGGLIGIWTLPQMAFLFAGHSLAVLIWGRRRWRTVITAGLVVLGALVVYWILLPNLIGQVGRVGSRAADRLGPLGLVTAPAELLFGPTLTGWGLPIEWPPAVFSILLVGLSVLAYLRLRSLGERAEGHQLFVPWVVTAAALVILGSSVLDRYISFMIVPMALVIVHGLAYVLERVRPVWLAIAIGAGLAGLCVVGMIGAGREWAVPFENYRDAVEVAQGSGIDRVITNREPGTVGFLFYDESVEVLQPTEAICAEPAPFVYFDFPVEPEERDLSCLAERGGRIVQVEQRRAPGSIDVWIVPA